MSDAVSSHRSLKGNRSDINQSSYAEELDRQDPLSFLRKEFIIPTKNDLKSRLLSRTETNEDGKPTESCIYFCGNSLGLQSRRTYERINSHLQAWAKKGVLGHFMHHEDSLLPSFIDVDDTAAQHMAPLVGGLKSEVAVMETLTANLHLMMASFYRPTKERYKIILECKAFPSDHYAVESQVRHHHFDPEDAMILIEPVNSETPSISTAHIISTITNYASSTALILLPGVQFYTGQYLDIQTITAHAHSLGIIIGWDLAHAVGNVDVRLHDWEVDFAVWCNYKYLNAGPGAIGGLFVHAKHGVVNSSPTSNNDPGFRPRLCGWWGGDRITRFKMNNHRLNTFQAYRTETNTPGFLPIPGAAGFQVGNPSVLALTALLASLEVFSMTSMSALRNKSIALTGYLEDLLLQPFHLGGDAKDARPYHIITPSDSTERGAQLSIQLHSGILEQVLQALEDAGVVVDERKPDVIRVAPTAMYNTFTEVWEFVQIFRTACQKAQSEDAQGHKNRDN